VSGLHLLAFLTLIFGHLTSKAYHCCVRLTNNVYCLWGCSLHVLMHLRGIRYVNFVTLTCYGGTCRRIWRLTDTDLCSCGDTQTISHIVESCPLTKLNGGLSRLHCGWRRCFVADQLWFMKCIREEEEEVMAFPVVEMWSLFIVMAQFCLSIVQPYLLTILYDSVYLTFSEKLMHSQLSLLHRTKRKI